VIEQAMSREEPAPRGLLISFEGVDGAGKSSHVEGLAAELRGAGRDVVTLREPGGTPLGERVRELLLDAELERSPRAELLLFQVARAELVAERIRPALEAGAVVLIDRFSDSTRAYQGWGLELERGLVEDALRLATGGLEPDLVILLDLEPARGLRRVNSAGKRHDAIESRRRDFLERVRRGYLELARREPERWLIVDAARPPAAVAAAVSGRVRRLLDGEDR